MGALPGRARAPRPGGDRRGQAALAVGGRPAARRRPGRARAAFDGAGAAAVSVLVDERFGGTLDDLRAARAATGAAAAREGLLLDARTSCASCAGGGGGRRALLLLRDLDDARAPRSWPAARELGLDALVEAHDAEELERAVRLGADPIGVNARDLATFGIDRRAQLELVARAPRPRRGRRERDRLARPGGGGGAGGRGRRPRRLGADARARSGREAARPARAAARQGLRADARGGRRRRGARRAPTWPGSSSRESPRRADRRARRARDGALGRGRRRRARRRRRRPRPALRARERAPRPRRRPAPRGAGEVARGGRPCLAGEDDRSPRAARARGTV